MRIIAMAATAQHAVLSFEAIRDEVQRRFPMRPITVGLVQGTSATAGGMVLGVDGILITVLFVDRPIPGAELQEAVRGGRIGWPTAGEALAGHRAHIIVATVNPVENNREAFAAASGVTFVMAAIAGLTDALGVYWSAARAVRATPDFIEAAGKLALRQIPIDTWIRLDFLQGSDNMAEGIFGAVTTGLAPFVGHELEFEPERMPPRAIAERIVGTAQHLVANGMSLSDGDTIAIDQNEQMRVRLVAQGQRPGVPAIRLRLERSQASSH